MTLCATAEISNLYSSEAEAGGTPYAVYNAEFTPSYDKDGVYKIVAVLTVKAYSKLYSEAESLAGAIDEVIQSGFSASPYTVRTVSQDRKDCLQKTWSVTYEYRITQYRQ